MRLGDHPDARLGLRSASPRRRCHRRRSWAPPGAAARRACERQKQGAHAARPNASARQTEQLLTAVIGVLPADYRLPVTNAPRPRSVNRRAAGAIAGTIAAPWRESLDAAGRQPGVADPDRTCSACWRSRIVLTPFCMTLHGTDGSRGRRQERSELLQHRGRRRSWSRSRVCSRWQQRLPRPSARAPRWLPWRAELDRRIADHAGHQISASRAPRRAAWRRAICC